VKENHKSILICASLLAISACGGGGSDSDSIGQTVSTDARRSQCVTVGDSGLTTITSGSSIIFVRGYTYTNRCTDAISLKVNYVDGNNKAQVFSASLGVGEAAGVKAKSVGAFGACEVSYKVGFTGSGYVCSK